MITDLHLSVPYIATSIFPIKTKLLIPSNGNFCNGIENIQNALYWKTKQTVKAIASSKVPIACWYKTTVDLSESIATYDIAHALATTLILLSDGIGLLSTNRLVDLCR